MRFGVDLAARFSAGMVKDSGGGVLSEFDSWGKSKFQVANEVADTAESYEVEYVGIEDVPYGIRDQFQVKPALKLQGRIEQEFEARGMLDKIVYFQPSIWQRHFHLFKAEPGVYANFAAELGYTPPNMRELHASEIPPLGKGDKEKAKLRTRAIQTLNKSKEDYVSAFLITTWLETFPDKDTLLGTPGVQPPT